MLEFRAQWKKKKKQVTGELRPSEVFLLVTLFDVNIQQPTALLTQAKISAPAIPPRSILTWNNGV